MQQIGRYRVEGVLGSGGMGTVYKVHLVTSGEPYALKRVKADRCGPHAERRFHQEAAIARALEHPNLVRVVDFGRDDDGGLYLAMELLNGEDLATRLERGPLTPAETARVGLGAAAGLGAAHRAGIVHRDIKPANLFLGAEGSVKVLDFGLAIASGDIPQGRMTTTGVFVGTPSYMAPEQLLALHTEDARTDVWGLCVTLYRAVAGRAPFFATMRLAQAMRVIHEDPDPLPDGVPSALADVILRGLQKDKGARFQSMDELASELGSIAASLVGAPAEPSSDPGSPADDPTIPGGREASTEALGPRRLLALQDELRIVSVLVGEEVLDLAAFRAAVEDELGGSIALVGDSAVGVFGGDAWRGDEAERAVRAGLRVREARAAFLLGVATGRARLGASSVSGGVVSKAEEVLSTEGVGVDDETKRRILGGFQLQGRRVVSARSGSLLEVMGLAGSDAPLLGRERELVQLLEHIGAAFTAPRAGGAVLVGPPGIGKSRLRHAVELSLLQSHDDLALLRGHAESHRALHAWHPFASALRSWAAIPEGASPDALRAGLAERVPAVIAPYLADLLGGGGAAASDAGSAGGDASVMAARVRGAIATLFDALAAERPTLLVLEDLHWADAATLELIEMLLRSLADRRFFVLASARGELPRPVHGLATVPIGPLPTDAMQMLVDGLVGPGPAADAIAARSSGNPLFAEELALGAQAGLDGLPMNVEAAVRARLDSLDREDLDLLRRAAVLGQRFTVQGLHALGARDVEAALVRLRRRDLVVPWSRARSGGLFAWRFRHDLVRDVLYATLTTEQRRALHAAAGRWLSTMPGAMPDEAAAHLEAADLHEEAGPLWRVACQRAFQEGDLRLALAASERAIATTPPAQLFDLHRARVEILVYRGGDQSEAIAAMEHAARTPEQHAVAAFRRSQQHRRAGDLARALAAARRGLAHRPGDVILASQELRLLAEQGQDVRARVPALAEEARRRAATPAERATVLWNLASCLISRGDLVPSLPFLSEAEDLYEEAGHTPRVAAVRADVAEVLQQLHPPETALRASHAAVAACRAAGNAVDEGNALRCLGLACSRVGDLEGAERAIAESESIAETLELPRLAVLTGATAALALLEHGQWQRALDRIEALLARPSADWRACEATLRGLQATALLGLGRPDDARDAARRGLAARTGAYLDLGEEELFVAAHEAGIPGALGVGVSATLGAAERIGDADVRRRFLIGSAARRRLLQHARAAGMPVPD